MIKLLLLSLLQGNPLSLWYMDKIYMDTAKILCTKSFEWYSHKPYIDNHFDRVKTTRIGCGTLTLGRQTIRYDDAVNETFLHLKEKKYYENYLLDKNMTRNQKIALLTISYQRSNRNVDIFDKKWCNTYQKRCVATMKIYKGE